MVKPICVCMSWRGGARFERCLHSIERSKHHFSRIVLSVTSADDSEDTELARAFQRRNPEVEVICTGRELPTMKHQAFWVEYLQRTGATSRDWVFWLAYDDEVRCRGIDSIVDHDGNWPLTNGDVYFGPWAMRHEQPAHLWNGDPNAPLESWTSFPTSGPKRLPLMTWIVDQLRQPTYMQMSGSVCPLGNFIEIKDGKPAKQGPMRIEMAVAAGSTTKYVAEFDEPLSIIYGRSNSDRANYSTLTRREDVHLFAWLLRYVAFHPAAAAEFTRLVGRSAIDQLKFRTGIQDPPSEEWRVGGSCLP